MTDPHSDEPLVLVVEDYQDAREMYSAYLQFSGYRVAEATNGLEAIEKTLELMPDIILMDLALPKVDGWEATKRLKSDERTKHIPIVALTGHALAGFADGARAARCAGRRGPTNACSEKTPSGRHARERLCRTAKAVTSRTGDHG
jgi:two-component system cell cycle response regulator DivK